MANCRCVLGVESGVSAFDLEDEVLDEYDAPRAAGRQPSGVDDLDDAAALGGRRATTGRSSPRHFEAASLRVCQVLFEGRYSGVMEPMVHYIPLAQGLLESSTRSSR